MNKQRARQMAIVFYLVAKANRLDGVRARALRVASKLNITRKELCPCELDAWGKRYLHHKRTAWRAHAHGIRASFT